MANIWYWCKKLHFKKTGQNCALKIIGDNNDNSIKIYAKVNDCADKNLRFIKFSSF